MNFQELFLTQFNDNHYYTFACTGLKHVHEQEFNTRDQANEYMYKMCKKYGLIIEKTYDDNHDKTYICNNNVRFYIQRV